MANSSLELLLRITQWGDFPDTFQQLLRTIRFVITVRQSGLSSPFNIVCNYSISSACSSRSTQLLLWKHAFCDATILSCQVCFAFWSMGGRQIPNEHVLASRGIICAFQSMAGLQTPSEHVLASRGVQPWTSD